MNIPESNMCLYLEHVFFFLSPLEKSFKTALQSAFQEKEWFPRWDFNFLSLCSGHLVHPPCCAPPRFPSHASACFPYICRQCWRRPCATSSTEPGCGYRRRHQRSPTAHPGKWVWGDRSSYPHSKLLWMRDVATCASSSLCMLMPTLGGDIKADRAALASFFPWISTTVFPLTCALRSAAA